MSRADCRLSNGKSGSPKLDESCVTRVVAHERISAIFVDSTEGAWAYNA